MVHCTYSCNSLTGPFKWLFFFYFSFYIQLKLEVLKSESKVSNTFLEVKMLHGKSIFFMKINTFCHITIMSD